MVKEIYRNSYSKPRKPARYLVESQFGKGGRVQSEVRFKWVAIILAWMRRDDYDVVVYDTKEDK